MNIMQISTLFLMCLFPILSLADKADESPHSPLCKKEEQVIFSFTVTKTNKTASLCEGEKSLYLSYRYGATDKIELQYPSRLDESSWSKFEFAAYSRGGGIENDAMGDYSVSFNNHGARYIVSQSWRLAEDEYFIGILVDINGKRYILQGDKESQVGSLVRLEGKPGLSK